MVRVPEKIELKLLQEKMFIGVIFALTALNINY